MITLVVVWCLHGACHQDERAVGPGCRAGVMALLAKWAGESLPPGGVIRSWRCAVGDPA